MSEKGSLGVGRLKLKGIGDVSSSKKKKKSKKKYKTKRREMETETGETKTVEAVRAQGTGRITTSGTVVFGLGTKFMSELKPQDGLEVIHPTSLKSEVRVVKMVVSDLSCSINSPFSSDLITSTQFHCLRLPRKEASKEEQEKESRKRKIEEEGTAFGTYAGEGGEKLTYRVKKSGAYGGYKIISQTTNKRMSREELLDARSKHKSDRMCM